MSAESTERQEVVRECIEGINVQQVLDRALYGFPIGLVPLNDVFILVCRDLFTQAYCNLRESGFQMEKKDLNPALSKLLRIYPPFVMILDSYSICDNVYLEVVLLTDENGLPAIERLQKIGMEAVVEGGEVGMTAKINGLYEEARGKGKKINLDNEEVEDFLRIFDHGAYGMAKFVLDNFSNPQFFYGFLITLMSRAAIDGTHTSVLNDLNGLKGRIKKELEKCDLLLHHHERSLRDILNSLKGVGAFEDYQETDDLITACQKLYIAFVIEQEIMRVPGGRLGN